MKINKIHIISFGGIKNFTLSFANGFNCIYGENEQGKTTIMSFIKMMFYGNEKSGSTISKNLRKKYTPWDASPMAGSIEFESGGRKYKLEREFRASNSTDKVSITDLSLGEKSAAEPNIGERLFGLSAAAFERSVFIGQLQPIDSNDAAEGELNAKLSNMVSTGDDGISLSEVTGRLEKERYAIISKSGKAGEYYKNTLTAKNLNDKLKESITANLTYSEDKKRLDLYKSETEKIISRANTVKAQISKEQDIKNAQKLKELLATKESLESIKQELTLSDGTPADDNFLRNIKFSISRLENARLQADAKEKETEIIKNQLYTLLNGPKLSAEETPETLSEDLERLNKNLNNLNTKANETRVKTEELKVKKASTKSAFNPLLLSLGIIFSVLGIFAFFIKLIIGVILVLSGAGLTVLSFMIKSHKKQNLLLEEISSLENILNTQLSHIEDIRSQMADKTAKLEAIKLASTSNSKAIEEARTQLQLYSSELQNLRNTEHRLKSELDMLLNKLNANDTLENTLARLERSAQKQKELKQHINFLLGDLNNISYDEARLKLAQIENGDTAEDINFEEIRAEYEKLSIQITERKATEARAEAQLSSLLTGIQSPDVLKSQLEGLNKALKSQKDFCDSIDIALEVLRESFAELRSNYGSQLEKKSAEIFSHLTNGKYSNMTVSKSFGINVEEAANPISREAEYLSNGTYDLAYLSMRLAVAELIGKDIPLFLDDALTQYDDTRALNTLSFLKEYCSSSQAVMFTCHKTIYNFAEKLGCSLNKL